MLFRSLAPGLKRNEKRWAYGFVIAATPLFLFGAFVAYKAMPQLLAVFLGFTPQNVSNIININEYLTFTLQILVFFGVGMLIPVVFVMLNFAGLLSSRALVRNWRWLLIGCLTFAAIATPTPDPFTMLLVAAPFLGVVTVAVGITALNDARRLRRRSTSAVADDVASPLEPVRIDPDDLRPSPIDDDRLRRTASPHRHHDHPATGWIGHDDAAGLDGARHGGSDANSAGECRARWTCRSWHRPRRDRFGAGSC